MRGGLRTRAELLEIRQRALEERAYQEAMSRAVAWMRDGEAGIVSEVFAMERSDFMLRVASKLSGQPLSDCRGEAERRLRCR